MKNLSNQKESFKNASIEDRLKAIRNNLKDSNLIQPKSNGATQVNKTGVAAWDNYGWTNFENWSNL